MFGAADAEPAPKVPITLFGAAANAQGFEAAIHVVRDSHHIP